MTLFPAAKSNVLFRFLVRAKSYNNKIGVLTGLRIPFVIRSKLKSTMCGFQVLVAEEEIGSAESSVGQPEAKNR